MLDYLKKFNSLPAELRERISNREAMAAMEKLEQKYQLPLAAFIMKVVVKEIALTDLVSFLLKENLTAAVAEELAEELKEKIFFSLGDYLFPPAPLSSPKPRPAYPAGRRASPLAEPVSAPARISSPLPEVRERPSEFKPPAAAVKSSDQASAKGASFFFSADDEQEIRALANRIDLAEKTELSAEKIESKLEAIINRVQINFGSAGLADRFKQILRTYLRGVRNKLETESTLVKSFFSGGLSFDKDSARKVMAVADKIVNPVESQSPIGTRSVFNGVNPVEAGATGTPPEPSEAVKLAPKIRLPELAEQVKDKSVIRDAPYDFSKLAKEKKDSAAADKKISRSKIEDVSHELAPLTPVRFTEVTARQAKPLAAKSKNDFFAPDKETNQAGDTSQMPLIRRRFEAENLSQSQKVKVEDVKYIPRVMSPLDEIKSLDLINFRRLDKDPLVAVGKIRGKIDLLEEEGYGKKLEGIKFWRSSPIYRLYLEIGHLSIGENKPVDVIIEERKNKPGDHLTAAEFKAIMDLNKSLRF